MVKMADINTSGSSDHLGNALSRYVGERYIWGVTRIFLGLIFFWAFIDKVFGLGFATCRNDAGVVEYMCSSAWLNGGSPTYGFLNFGTAGPFKGIFQAMAGNVVVDWLFMLGLLGIGVALIFGIGMRVACLSGGLMVFLMWLAHLPPEHHPFLDDHVMYAIILIGLWKTKAGRWLGFGEKWENLEIVKKFPFLA